MKTNKDSKGLITQESVKEICMDIEPEGRCTQDKGHTFMTPYYGI